MSRSLKFVVTAGGTAGHINPALAVACELRDRGHEIIYAGTAYGMESRLIPKEGFEYMAFNAAGFNRKKPHTLIASTLKVAASSSKAKKWLLSRDVDAVVGFGGYVSIPVGLAASRLNIPLAVHEQNSASGMANRFLAKRADLVALAYESVASEFKTNAKVVVTGNPVRKSLLCAQKDVARQKLDLPIDAKVLLVFGGSLGAEHLNLCLAKNMAELAKITDLHIVHVSGSRDFSEMTAAKNSAGVAGERWHLVEYCYEMDVAYAAADLVLSRGGATTLAELKALGKPALIVPYPHAAADEQTKNAQHLVDFGAAEIVSDAGLDEPEFMDKLRNLIVNDDYRGQMARAAANMPGSNATAEVATLLELMVKSAT